MTKRMDKASDQAVHGRGRWRLRRDGQDQDDHHDEGQGDTFLTYELSDTGLSGYSDLGGGDAPTERLSLNFTKVTGHLHGPRPEDRRHAGQGGL